MNPPDHSAKPLFAALVGLDWGDRQHALALRPADTSSIETSTLDHSAENVRAWIQQIEQRFGGRPVALALETSKGPLIHLFFDVPWLTVYPIHPATSARIRKAFTPSGAKDDTPDAQVLLSLLVHHLEQLRPLLAEDALTRHLAARCQLRRKPVDQRTQVSNQLRAALKGYYPQALQLVGRRCTARWPWTFSNAGRTCLASRPPALGGSKPSTTATTCAAPKPCRNASNASRPPWP